MAHNEGKFAAKGQQCFKCGKLNHYARCCLTKTYSGNQAGYRARYDQQNARTNSITQEPFTTTIDNNEPIDSSFMIRSSIDDLPKAKIRILDSDIQVI